MVLKNWKNVTELQFTFAVDRDTIKGSGRSWTWQPKKTVYICKPEYKTLNTTEAI